MVVICYADDVKGYDRRNPELSNAPLHITQDANSADKLILDINLPGRRTCASESGCATT